MLGEHWRDRRDHHRLRRLRTRWRLFLLSLRGRWLLYSFLLLVSIVVFQVGKSLLRYRRRLAWDVPALPHELSELFTDKLYQESQHFDTATPRGIVLPLYDDIALLGFSLVLELRHFQVNLPIEVPHCGDLSEQLQQTMKKHDPMVNFYDVCELAASAAMGDGRKLFCVDLEHCRHKFRSFDIKVLAVIYSKFQEIMLLDADTLFFQSPMSLWTTDKYKNTGTLFFHDRISYELSYLAARQQDEAGQLDMTLGALHRFLSDFDVAPYRHFQAVKSVKPRLQVSRLLGLDFSFGPSKFLLYSHSWQLRSGHQMDSSLVLWNKARQSRATAILASFVSLNGLSTVPSYGDKELYWIACELAETAYSFSDYAVGAIGSDLLSAGRDNDGVLCGDALQHFPMQMNPAKDPKADVEPLYMNSDSILEWGRDLRSLYRTAARPAGLYPGSFTEKKLLQTCPFDVTTMELAPLEMMLLTQRRQFHDVVSDWIDEDRRAWWNPFA